MEVFEFKSEKFRANFSRWAARSREMDAEIEGRVRKILSEVRGNGDAALLEYTERFDRVSLSKETLRVSKKEIQEALKKINPQIKQSLLLAAERIERFHRERVPESWELAGKDGTIIGQRVRPLQKVGIYVPGGKAVYPSSVLMNALPARAAGVREIVMVTPPQSNGEILPEILVAADIAQVESVFRVGGAQAIGALAYGTEIIPKVEKIVGPGNIYVTCAKKAVFGEVDIDMIAGPSEIVVIADDGAEPAFAAADLLSQAEHDELASAVLITPSRSLGEKVLEEVERQLQALPRRDLAAQSLEKYGAVILVADLEEAADAANALAPEHLELMVKDPHSLADRIQNAGAIFLGYWTPEAVGDYVAGPSHVLPTGGTARFFSPLGTEDFLKRSSIISYTREALEEMGEDIIRLAESEGLDAHARSVKVRLKKS